MALQRCLIADNHQNYSVLALPLVLAACGIRVAGVSQIPWLKKRENSLRDVYSGFDDFFNSYDLDGRLTILRSCRGKPRNLPTLCSHHRTHLPRRFHSPDCSYTPRKQLAYESITGWDPEGKPTIMTLRTHLLAIAMIASLAGCNTLQHPMGLGGQYWFNNTGTPHNIAGCESAKCSFDEGYNFDVPTSQSSGCDSCDAGCTAGGCTVSGCGGGGATGGRGRAMGNGALRARLAALGCAGGFCDGRCGGRCCMAMYRAGFAMQNMGGYTRHALQRVPAIANMADRARQRAAVGHCQGPPGPSAGAVTYPYYTTRGPRDFFLDDPPGIGP